MGSDVGSRENHDKKTASLSPLHGGCNSITRKLKTEVQTMRLLRTDDQVALQRSEIRKPDRSPSISPLQTPTVLPRSLQPVGHDIRLGTRYHRSRCACRSHPLQPRVALDAWMPRSRQRGCMRMGDDTDSRNASFVRNDGDGVRR